MRCASLCALRTQGSLKLIDFGIAKKLSNDTTNIVRDSQVGTVNYMSPESITADMGNLGVLKVRTRARARQSGGSERWQSGPHTAHTAQAGEATGVRCGCAAPSHAPHARRGAQLGRPSDVWSLGCILFAMVYGKTPFEHVKNLIARLRAISDPAFQIDFKPIQNPHLLDVLRVSTCAHAAAARCARRVPLLRVWCAPGAADTTHARPLRIKQRSPTYHRSAPLALACLVRSTRHRMRALAPRAARTASLCALPSQRCLRREPSERPTIPELLAHPFLQPPEIAPAAAPAGAPSGARGAASRAGDSAGAGASGAPLTAEQMQQLIGQLSEQISLRAQQAPGSQAVPDDATEQLTRALLGQLLSAQRQLHAAAVPAQPNAPCAASASAAAAAGAQPSSAQSVSPPLLGAGAPLALPPPPPPPPPAATAQGKRPAAVAHAPMPDASAVAHAPQPPSVYELQSRMASLQHVAAPAASASAAARTAPSGVGPELARQILERHGQLNHVEPRVQNALLGRPMAPAPAEARFGSWLSTSEEKSRRVQQAQQARGEYASDEPITGYSFI